MPSWGAAGAAKHGIAWDACPLLRGLVARRDRRVADSSFGCGDGPCLKSMGSQGDNAGSSVLMEAALADGWLLGPMDGLAFLFSQGDALRSYAASLRTEALGRATAGRMRRRADSGGLGDCRQHPNAAAR